MAGKPLLEVGEAALRAGKRERALAIFRRIVDRCPPSLDTLAAIAYLRAEGTDAPGLALARRAT